MAATPAEVKRLADELITCITGLTPQEDPENFELCREFTLRNFKGYKFGRTNQFDVNSKLSGLEEKFRVYNRDDIADALRSRLDELPVQTFTPELLSLFLSLSDRPLENAHLDDLDALIKHDNRPKGLTWADIIAEEPLEGDIWRDVDFGAESSDEWSDNGEDDLWERRETEMEGRKRKGRWAEEEEEDVGRGASIEGFIITGDKEGLEMLKMAQYWDEEHRIRPVEEEEIDVSLGSGGVEGISIISEVQAVREVLFMLLGHPCVLFQSANGIVSVETPMLSTQFALRHTSLSAFKALLNWYGDKGTQLNRIRSFTSVQNAQISPEQQTFTSAVAGKLFLLDQHLIEIEQRFVGNVAANQIASLLSLQSELEPFLSPYMLLSNIIAAITNPSTHIPQTTLATLHLEHLFTSACTLQSINDHSTFTFMTSLFFTCLQTYLRPIRAWMERGELRSGEIFLVTQTRASDEVELGGLWQDQFSLRRDVTTGALQAPRFVHAAADRIFITGKSVVFLKRLVEHNLPSAMLETDAANAKRGTAVELTVPEGDSLAPFQDVFAAAFEKWINDRHHSVSSRLRDILYRDCGLWKSLDALECVYLCSDGYLFDLLAGQVFEKIDKGVETWGDRFLLTEMVQGVYSGVPSVEVIRLRMRGRTPANNTLRDARKSVKMLSGVEVDYALPWPIMNILNKHSFTIYKSVHTLLLQIRRAQHALKRLTVLKTDMRRHGDPTEGKLYYSLKHRLLWFTDTLYYYLTVQVLMPLTAKMRKKMEEALDVDGMIGVHDAFINKVQEQCLLGPKLAPIHQTIITLLDLAISFSDAHAALLLSDDPASPRRKAGGDDTDSDDDDQEGVDLDDGDHHQEDGYGQAGRRVLSGSVRFNALLDFIKAGLRGVARAGVMPHLETLAEGLDGVGWGGRYG